MSGFEKLKRVWTEARVLVLLPVAILISPFGRWTALMLSICSAIGFALHLAGFPATLLWRLSPVAVVLSIVIGWRLASRSVDAQDKGPEIYDKAKYHYGGDFPKELPRKQAFVHTGIFVGWLIDHDMIAKDFLEETQGFKERKITGAEVYKRWDGTLSSEMLTEEGNRFASHYFDFDRGKFLDDYEAVLVRDLPSHFQVADTWENYDLIRAKIDERYTAWKRKQQKA